MVTIGNAMEATIPVAFGQTRCNVLIDTGAMKSCMSQTFYQQLMLPTMRSIYMSCICETTCFPANCMEPTHLDSLPVGKECG